MSAPELAYALPGARVLFTTRDGGVSGGPYASLNLGRSDPAQETDDPAAVAENRRRAAARTGKGAATLALARQVHGTRIGEPGEQADGLVARDKGAVAAVLVADCLPIAIAAADGVAILHAGWRGLAGGIVAEGARALAGPTHAVIGPGIGPCCFAVGDEVRAAFADVPEARHGDRVDLKAIARRRLEQAGVGEIADAGLCTKCDARFFSHRRDGGVTGRQAGIAWRT